MCNFESWVSYFCSLLSMRLIKVKIIFFCLMEIMFTKNSFLLFQIALKTEILIISSAMF